MKIREMVRTEMAKHILNEKQIPQEETLEEGLGTNLVRAIGAITGAAGAHVAGNMVLKAAAPAMISLQLAAGAGLVSPLTVIGMAGSVIFSMAALTYFSAKVGLEIAKGLTDIDSVVASRDLRKVIDERDKLIREVVTVTGDESKALKQALKHRKALDALTSKQKKLAKKLHTAAKKDLAADKISDKEYKGLLDIAEQGMQGKLSYLAEK